MSNIRPMAPCSLPPLLTGGDTVRSLGLNSALPLGDEGGESVWDVSSLSDASFSDPLDTPAVLPSLLLALLMPARCAPPKRPSVSVSRNC